MYVSCSMECIFLNKDILSYIVCQKFLAVCGTFCSHSGHYYFHEYIVTGEILCTLCITQAH